MFVGVHGIGQQQLGRHQLLGSWTLALRDGLERASGEAVAEPRLDIAFYGDVFLGPSGPLSKGSDSGANWSMGLSDEEAAWLMSAALEIVTEEEVRLMAHTETKAAPRVPAVLRPVLAALDRRLGHRASALLIGELRQVRRYLTERSIKDEVDRRLRMCAAEGRVLIGHSLGSVVAFEYLRQNRGHRLDLLLTLGSPLRLRTVRSLMPNPLYGTVRYLPGRRVGAWVNLWDPADPVACAGELSALWPGVTDHRVDNGDDPHAVTRYLGKREAGEAVRAALPGWADV
ncbi:hypothetical protein [Streptomyces sp. NPDC001530]|uniref:hypothetical protein n=1 Tax=Streptomyces sp. NPDC001530 TaxID=3364582 RepID=UPI003699607E